MRQIHKLKQTHEVILLRGNHEAMLLQARHNREHLPFWIECGGGATLDSYHAKSFDDIPNKDWSFFESSQLYYETEEAIFVHANLDPTFEMSCQTESDLLWRFYDEGISSIRNISFL
jgi:serine/threonine protein phosphatase 1